MRHIIKLLLLILLLLSGCNTKQNTNSINSDNQYIKEINIIIPDDNTLRYYEIPENKEKLDNKEEMTQDKKYNIYEVKLMNEPNIDWRVSDEQDIIYNNKRFIGLDNVISKIESPYTKEQLIKFILITFKSTENEIYCELETYKNDSSSEVYDEELINTDDNSILEAEMSRWGGYASLCNKYNDNVEWIINIYEKDNKYFAKIYGCNSFVAVTNVGQEIKIDLSLE